MASKKDSEALHKAFMSSIEEVELVLARKRAITDISKLASVTIGSYVKIKCNETHERGLDIVVKRLKLIE